MSCNGPGDCTCQEPPACLMDIEVFCWHQFVGWTPFDTGRYIGWHLPFDCSAYGGLQDRFLRKIKTRRWHGTYNGQAFEVTQTDTYWQDHWTGQSHVSQDGYPGLPPGYPDWVPENSVYGITQARWWVTNTYHHLHTLEPATEEIQETLSEPFPVSQFLAECHALYTAFSLERLIDFADGVQEQWPLGVKWLYVIYDASGQPQLSASGDRVVLEQSPYEGYWYDALYLLGAGTEPAEYPWFHFNGLQSIRVVGQASAHSKATLIPESIMRNVVEPLAAPCGPWSNSTCAPAPIPMEGYVQVFRESPGKEIILPGTC